MEQHEEKFWLIAQRSKRVRKNTWMVWKFHISDDLPSIVKCKAPKYNRWILKETGKHITTNTLINWNTHAHRHAARLKERSTWKKKETRTRRKEKEMRQMYAFKTYFPCNARHSKLSKSYNKEHDFSVLGSCFSPFWSFVFDIYIRVSFLDPCWTKQRKKIY